MYKNLSSPLTVRFPTPSTFRSHVLHHVVRWNREVRNLTPHLNCGGERSHIIYIYMPVPPSNVRSASAFHLFYFPKFPINGAINSPSSQVGHTPANFLVSNLLSIMHHGLDSPRAIKGLLGTSTATAPSTDGLVGPPHSPHLRATYVSPYLCTR